MSISSKQILFSIAGNGSGIAEGRVLEVESFNFAKMPNRSNKD